MKIEIQIPQLVKLIKKACSTYGLDENDSINDLLAELEDNDGAEG